VIEDLGLTGKMAECRAKMAWEEAVGASLALQTRPVRIHRGRLEVAVPSSVWRAQLSFMKRDIVDRINKLIGEEVVKELVLLNRR
jgi:hypothetical protein